MSSRDIGPALPPHMRRSEGRSHGDTRSKTKRSEDNERYEGRKDESRRHKSRYDGKSRHQDLERKTGYLSSCSPNRSRDLERKREARFRQEKDEGREKWRRERMNKEAHGELRNSGSSRHSKRSKTDRTYNTDTEESSDSSDDNQESVQVRNVDISEPDSEEEDEKVSGQEHLDHLSSSSGKVEPSGGGHLSEGSSVIGPALPPNLSKNSFVSDSDVDTDRPCTSSTSSKPYSLNPGRSPALDQAVLREACESDGVALPPHLLSKQNEETSERSSMMGSIGPSLPPPIKEKTLDGDKPDNSVCIGPALPPNLHRISPIDEDDIPSTIGPALPPHLQKKGTTSQIGPALPPSLEKVHRSCIESEAESPVIGPALPPHLKESTVTGPALPPGMKNDGYHHRETDEDGSDDEVLGPLLPEEMTKSGKNLMIQAQLERNAAAIKRKFEEKDTLGSGISRREEWMLELPPEGSVDLGLGPRTFRARGAPEKGADRSMWTDTPADKARKEEEAKRRFELGISSTEEIKKVAVSKELSGKDKSMDEVVKKHKRSKESLLDSHQKKIKEEKKKKEKAGVKQERRPFNRETDLKTNVFDDAQKKSIFKKAQLLDSRFSRGESKFL